MDRPGDGAAGALRRRSSIAISPRSNGRCISRTPARDRHADPGEHPGAGPAVCPGALRRVPPAPCGRQPVRGERLSAAGDRTGSGEREANRRGRRPAHQFRHALLQSGSAHRIGRDCGRRLARPMVVPLDSRRGRRPAGPGRAGADASSAAARRRDPHAVARAAVLDQRLDSRPEHLAALDARPQRPQAERQTAAAGVVRLQFASLQRDGRCQRGKPEDVHRPLPGGRNSDRPLVDGRRLVSVRSGRLAQDRHAGRSTGSDFPAACGRSATTPMPRGSRRSSGSSRSGCIRTRG